MAVTSILPPSANAAVGTGFGDGVTYGGWSFPTRMYAGGSNASVVTAANKATLWSGCFSSEIPAGATITGVELVGSGSSRFGNSGSTSTGEIMTFTMRLYNGSSYSAALPFLSTPSGGTLNGDSTELSLNGANKYYRDWDASTTNVFCGASDSLSGLTWDPADQANFGFAISVINEVGSVVGVMLGEGNIGLRVTYSTQFPDKVIGEPPADILKVNGIATSSVTNISYPSVLGTVPTIYNVLYQFEGESTQTHYALDWSPSNNWVNGSSATAGTYWGRVSNKTVKGWNCDQERTPSTTTGPDDGVDVSDGSHDNLTKYLYTEATSGRYAYCFVTRMPAFNSNDMLNSGNDLELRFWVHAYGSNMGDLYVYIDDQAATNHSASTELAAYESFSGFTTYTSAWQQKTISLNSYKDGTDYYIYFVSQNATNYRADLAIDGVEIREVNL